MNTKKLDQIIDIIKDWKHEDYAYISLFYRYISDKIVDYVNENERKSDPNFDYRKISDEKAELWKESLINEIWYFIKPSNIFDKAIKRMKKIDNIYFDLYHALDAIEINKELVAYKIIFDNFLLFTPQEQLKKTKMYEMIKIISELDLDIKKDDYIKAFEYLFNKLEPIFYDKKINWLIAKIASHWKKKVKFVDDPNCYDWVLFVELVKVMWRKNIIWWFNYTHKEFINFKSHLIYINLLMHWVDCIKAHTSFDKADIIMTVLEEDIKWWIIDYIEDKLSNDWKAVVLVTKELLKDEDFLSKLSKHISSTKLECIIELDVDNKKMYLIAFDFNNKWTSPLFIKWWKDIDKAFDLYKERKNATKITKTEDILKEIW